MGRGWKRAGPQLGTAPVPYPTTLLSLDQAAFARQSLFGATENAVKSQIWIAVSVYILVAIVRKRLNLSRSLYEILQILSLNQFEKTPLDMLLSRCTEMPDGLQPANQLSLFE